MASIEFNGQNASEIAAKVKAIAGLDCTLEPSGKFTVVGETVCREDVVSIEPNKVTVSKPRYVIDSDARHTVVFERKD